MTPFHTSAAIGQLNADLRQLSHSQQVEQLKQIAIQLMIGVEHGPSKLRAAADKMDENTKGI